MNNAALSAILLCCVSALLIEKNKKNGKDDE